MRAKGTMNFDYEQLDPGIRRLVRWLHSQGFTTTDSGDGVTKFEAVEELRKRVLNGEVDCAAPLAKAIELTNCSIQAPHVFMTVAKSRMIALTDDLVSALAKIGIAVKPICGPDDYWPCMQATYDPANGIASIELMNVDDRDLPEWVGAP